MFTYEQHPEAFREAGFETAYDEQGLVGQGLYIGIVPLGEADGLPAS